MIDKTTSLLVTPQGIGGLLLAAILYYYIYDYLRGQYMGLPTVSGGYPFFGQVFEMIRGSPWYTMVRNNILVLLKFFFNNHISQIMFMIHETFKKE